MSLIYIPLQRSEEHVALPVDQLAATDPIDLIRMLVRERVPLEIWLRVAAAYRKIGRIEAYETMIQLATGSKQRRGYNTISQFASEQRRANARVMSQDEESALTQEWMRVRGASDYESGVSMAMLFDSMAAHLLNNLLKLSAASAVASSSQFANLSEREREKRKRDLQTEATWYLQQADVTEKSRFVGASSEWYHHLVVGLQYFIRKDDGKAAAEFKQSLALFESRAARIGHALVLMRGAKYIEALEELSRVYMSIYSNHLEPFDLPVESSSSEDPRAHNPRWNPNADYEWFKQHVQNVKSSANPQYEMLTTFSSLRPLMASLWNKIGVPQRAIEILQLQLKVTEEALSNRVIDHPPANHDRTLAMLGTLLINKYGDMMMKAKNPGDVEAAAHVLTDSLQHLKSAFQLNPDNPNVLNHLSNLFFSQKAHEERDYERIDNFAGRAKEIALQSGFKEIAAESCYYLGRSAHAQEKFPSARQHYLDALVNSPNFPLPRYGLAQLAYHDKDYGQAIDHLTKLDAKIPDLADTKAFLGRLHLMMAQNPSSASDFQDHYGQATKLLTRSIQLNPSNMRAHLDLAEVKERVAPLDALAAYLQASDLSFQLTISESGIDVDAYKAFATRMFDSLSGNLKDMESDTVSYPSWLKKLNLLSPRLVWNNVAVMRMTNGQLSEAKDALLRTILLGASTFLASDANSLSHLHYSGSNASSKRFTFVNPSTYAPDTRPALNADLVFTALFGKPLRELLPSAALQTVEDFIVRSAVYLLPLNLTTGYNLGLCYEKMKQNDKAIAIYTSILDRYPQYLDAKLRLALLKRDSGLLDEAETLLRQITSITETKENATTKSMAGIMLANVLMTKKEYKETQTMLDALVNKLSASKSGMGDTGAWTFGSDVYALTQYANFFLMTSYNSPAREKNLKWASSLFSSVLKNAPGNVYAAHGLAIIHALQAKEELASQEASSTNADTNTSNPLSASTASAGNVKWSDQSRNAMNAFLAIREACPNLPDVVINLGHLSFAVGDFRGAAKHYQSIWAKYGPNSVFVQNGQVASMLARSLSELNHFDQAKATMESALEHNPTDDDLWFNLAVLCKDWALGVLKRVDHSLARAGRTAKKVQEDEEEDNGTMDVDATEETNGAHALSFLQSPSEDDQLKAINLLLFATPIFERLTNPKGKHSFSTKKCEKFAKLCEHNRELAQDKLETFKEEMNKEREARDRRRKEAEEEEQKQLEALEQEEAALRERIAQENEVAEALRLKSQQIVEEWVASGGGENDHKKTKKKSTSRKRNAYDSDSEDEEDRNARIVAAAREEEEAALPEEEERAATAADFSDEEAGGTGDAGDNDGPSTRRARRDRRKTVQDDDEEDASTDIRASQARNTASEADRQADLELLAKRRQQAKRAHEGITPNESEANAAPSEAASASQEPRNDTSTHADDDDDDESGASAPKRRKLRENRQTQEADDDLELPEGMDL